MNKNAITRYLGLRANIRNWQEYTFHKKERKQRPLRFVTKPHALQLEVNQHNYGIFKEIFVEDFYNASDFLSALPKNPVVIDIGANVGFFAVLMLSKIPECRFYCYEPLPANLRHLEKLKAANPDYADQIAVFGYAVAGKAGGEITLYTEENPDESSIASIHQSFDTRNKQSITVPVTDLSTIVNTHQLNEIDILKLDCEGAEYDILYNTPASILNKVRFLLLEVHDLDEQTSNIAAMQDFLHQHQFKTTTHPFHNNCYYVFARKQ